MMKFRMILTILALAIVSFCANAQATKPKSIILIDGYFFSEMPVAKTDIVKMHIINSPSGTTAIGLELSKPLPEEAIQYAVPIENVTDGKELLERYNEAISKASGLEVSITKKGVINEGDKFLEFSATDVNGKIWTNADVKGKVMVLNLWFTGCRPCRAEMPELSEWKDEMPDAMFFSATYENAERAKPVIESQGFNWIALINDTQFAEFIGSNGYPMTIVVDKAGVITMIEYGTSPTQRTKLKEEIRKLIEQ